MARGPGGLTNGLVRFPGLSSFVLSVSTLNPEGVLWDFLFHGGRKATPVYTDAGEQASIVTVADCDVVQVAHDHAGDLVESRRAAQVEQVALPDARLTERGNIGAQTGHGDWRLARLVQSWCQVRPAASLQCSQKVVRPGQLGVDVELRVRRLRCAAGGLRGSDRPLAPGC